MCSNFRNGYQLHTDHIAQNDLEEFQRVWLCWQRLTDVTKGDCLVGLLSTNIYPATVQADHSIQYCWGLIVKYFFTDSLSPELLDYTGLEEYDSNFNGQPLPLSSLHGKYKG